MIDPELIQTTIPFCGFYQSLADGQIDMAVEQLQENADEEPESCLHGVPDLWDKINYRALHLEYAQDYLELYQEWLADEWELEIQLHFGELISPREYNFETDRISAQLTPKDLLKLRHAVRDPYERVFRQIVHDQLEQRSGFIPFYSNNLDDWPDDPLEWESPQIGLLFEVFGELPDDLMYEQIDADGLVDKWLELPEDLQDG